MKTFRTILTAVAILFGAMTMNAQRMSYEAISNNARFLTDRMAYELGIRSMSIIDDIYRINFDYIYGVNEYLDEIAMGYYYDDYNDICAQRDYALRRLLGDYIWNRLVGYSYFYRPITFANRRWHFCIYDYDRYGVNHYFYSAPRHYSRHYEGGHYFHGMRPAGGHVISGHAGVPNRHGADRYNGHPQGGMHNDRPQGGMNNGRPQGGMNNGHQGNMNSGRPQGGMHNDRPQGNTNSGYQNGMHNDRPQGNMNSGRPQGGMNNDRPSSSSHMRESGTRGHSDSGYSSSRSSMNSNSSSRSASAPSRSSSSSSSPSRGGFDRGSSNGGSNHGGSHGGGARGGRR